ncbi:MAG TPA: maleylpyruvate isomerase family mycothiol-dependent enzyme [Pseudonocardiaceae bacterium]
MPLGNERFSQELRDQSDIFVDVVSGADPGTRVPTCPEWTLRELIRHVGRAYYWVTAILSSGSTSPTPLDDVPDGDLPERTDQYGDWVRAGATRMVDAAAAAGPDAAVWTWAGDGGAGFWLRRITHETVVHRADAAIAVGRDFTVAPDLAVDGITEQFEILPAIATYRRTLAQLAGTGQTLHFHATDADDGEWLVRRIPDGFTWAHGHAKADVAVRATAADLLLLLSGRTPADGPGVEIFGDDALLAHWLEHTKF